MRERVVWVLRRNNTYIFQQIAENVGCRKDLYGFGAILDVDPFVCKAEGHFISSVDRLLEAKDDWFHALSWVKLCEYISSLFARDPDFEEELFERFQREGKAESLKEYLTTDNANAGRLAENQLVSGPVVRARWRFLKSPEEPFILNDRAMTVVRDTVWQIYSYIIPLRTDFAVQIGTGTCEPRFKWSNGAWHIAIPTFYLSKENTEFINRNLWRFSRQEVYGPEEAELKRILDAYGNDPDPPPGEVLSHLRGAGYLGLDPESRIENEMLLSSLPKKLKEPENPDEVSDIVI